MRRLITSRLVVGFLPFAAAVLVAPGAVSVAAGIGVIDATTDGASAQVIAQGVVTFAAGDFHWTAESVAINTSLAPVGTTAAGFVVASGPVAAIVSSSAGTVWRLGPGEAAFRPVTTTNSAMAEAEGASSLIMVNVDAGPGSGTFAPGAGARDVDLVRAQLAPGSSLTVLAEVSALVYVTSGEIETDDTAIASGATTVRPGDVVLANAGTESATVLVATIGRSVDVSGLDSPLEAPPTSDGAAPPPTPAPTNPPAPAPTNPPETAAPTTAASATADVDQDGLTGNDEELRGTDPNSSDTDADGLTDGFEVFESGTNPTVADGDGDGASDGQEVDAGTNPNLDEDSDGDGVPDSDEILSGGDPFDPNDQP
jgi:hypothetical protein